MADQDQGTLPRRPFGQTGIGVPPLCLGCAPLSSLPQAFNYAVPEERALETIRAAFAGPLNYLDTSNSYGGGESERRIGKVIRELGGVPAGAILQSKADRDPTTKDFSGPRMRRSIEESLERLGVERLEIAFLHDPEYGVYEELVAPDGAVDTLRDLQREGIIGHLGVAGGPIDLLIRFLELGGFAAVLTHNRFTLLDRRAAPLLDYATARGIAVLNAAPYGGGMLVKGPDAFPKYMYKDAPPEMLARVREIAALCDEYGIPLPAAALQFSTRDPRIHSTVVGLTRPERLAQTIDLYQHPIPDEFWARLDSTEG
jgi:D-threo-aldose 1-dehydrogenase